MKKLIGIYTLFLILASCKNSQVANVDYIQLYETQATNSTQKNDFYIYETDTLKIIYSFWADKGQMRFSVYNKTSVPLYIDWFKSSFISNAVSMGYCTDGSKPKTERIGFIPPKSYISKAEYILANKFFTDWGTDFVKKTEQRHDNPKMSTTISSKQFTKESSPINFRNYLTFSFKEDFSNEFRVDNEYYVKTISVMDKRQFWDSIPQDGSLATTRFEKAKDFYLKVK
jgi:hypothetical protein